MNLLAIDPGLHTGLCCTIGEGLCHGVANLGGSDTPQQTRDLRLADYVEEWITLSSASTVAYEGAAFSKNTFASRQLAGYRGIIRMTAAKHGCQVVEVNPSTLKKWATNNGNAKKPQMVRALKTMYGIKVLDDNEADAIWIWQFVNAGQHAKIEAARAATKRPKRRAAQERLF